MTRINCHSSFKHYEMFHSGCGGGNNYGSIFNTTYNIDCNGHGGGFWGGFGYGLGNAFGGLFSGLFGGGMNMGFGGFGMGGFGFPMFNNFGFGGFGIPSWGGGWFGGGSRVGDDDDGSVKRKKASDDDGDRDKVEGNKDLECKDPDRQKIVDYGKKVNELRKKEDLQPAELKALYDQIKTSQEESRTEGHHDNTDPDDYQNWLNGLKDEAIKRGWGDIESEDFGKGIDPEDKNDEVETPENRTGNNPGDLTLEQIKSLTNPYIAGLTPEQAAEYLKKLGIEDGAVIKDANNISVLLLLEKAGIDVKIAQNTHESVTDQWIQGKISGVQQDKDGKISYSVDCTAHGSQKNKYKFEQKENDSPKYKVTVTEFGEGAKYANNDVTSVEYEYDSASGYLKRYGYKFTTEL